MYSNNLFWLQMTRRSALYKRMYKSPYVCDFSEFPDWFKPFRRRKWRFYLNKIKPVPHEYDALLNGANFLFSMLLIKFSNTWIRRILKITQFYLCISYWFITWRLNNANEQTHFTLQIIIDIDKVDKMLCISTKTTTQFILNCSPSVSSICNFYQWKKKCSCWLLVERFCLLLASNYDSSRITTKSNGWFHGWKYTQI